MLLAHLLSSRDARGWGTVPSGVWLGKERNILLHFCIDDDLNAALLAPMAGATNGNIPGRGGWGPESLHSPFS